MSPLVASLQAPLHAGRDVVWSASLGLAADALGRFASRDPASPEPLRLEGEGSPAARALLACLEEQRAFAAAAPPGAFALAAPYGPDFESSLSAKLRELVGASAHGASLAARGAEAGWVPGSVTAYSAMTDGARFAVPFARRADGLVFAGAPAQSFGVWDSEDPETLVQARVSQVRVHDYVERDDGSDEMVVQLVGDDPEVELVIGMLPRTGTLAEALEALSARLGRATGADERLAVDERLELPCVSFDLEHRWGEAHGHHLRGVVQPLGEVVQRVQLTLDEGGVSSVSEALIATLGLTSRSFVFNRPFLLLLRRRGRSPHLVCWLETADLLAKAPA